MPLDINLGKRLEWLQKEKQPLLTNQIIGMIFFWWSTNELWTASGSDMACCPFLLVSYILVANGIYKDISIQVLNLA